MPKAPPAPHEELRSAHVKALESISQLTKENVRALQRVEQLTKANDTLQQQLDGRLVPSGVQSLLELKDAAEAELVFAEAIVASGAILGQQHAETLALMNHRGGLLPAGVEAARRHAPEQREQLVQPTSLHVVQCPGARISHLSVL